MPSVLFTRPTLIAAVALIDRSLSQAAFNHLVLRLGLEPEIPSNTALSVSKKADTLGRIAVQRPTDPVATLGGTVSLAEAVIREAVRVMRPNPVHETETAFARGLARDGYVVAFDERERPALRAALPEALGLPAVDNEVDELLKHFGFVEPLGHLGQGIKQCLSKKNDPKFAGHDLLIEAPLLCLPKERWGLIEDDLRSAAQPLPFREIHIIGDQTKSLFGFRIK
jgi:hypothetical protein